MKHIVRIVSALVLAIPTLAFAQYDEYTTFYTVPLSSGTSTTPISVAPFTAPYGNGPLVTVLLSYGAELRGQFIKSGNFSGNHAVVTSSRIGASLEFPAGMTAFNYSFGPVTGSWPLKDQPQYFIERQYLAFSLSPRRYDALNSEFALFNGNAPIIMNATKSGSVEILSGAPPQVTLSSGSSVILGVTYIFVPGPGVIAVAGASCLMLAARRRRDR
jgi:hypothetical protein